jgi:hypothetical protein
VCAHETALDRTRRDASPARQLIETATRWCFQRRDCDEWLKRQGRYTYEALNENRCDHWRQCRGEQLPHHWSERLERSHDTLHAQSRYERRAQETDRGSCDLVIEQHGNPRRTNAEGWNRASNWFATVIAQRRKKQVDSSFSRGFDSVRRGRAILDVAEPSELASDVIPDAALANECSDHRHDSAPCVN